MSRKRFSVESWKANFVALGFHSIVLSRVACVFTVLREKFGVEIVDFILSDETVGDIARVVLWDEVDYFSTQATTKKENERGGGSTQSELKSKTQNSQHTPSLGVSFTSPSDETRKTSDEEDEDLPKTSQQSSDPSTKLKYSQRLHDLNHLASEKGVKLIFSNKDIMDVQTSLSLCISGVDASLYHGTDIPNDELVGTITSFLNYGVETSRAYRRGYYSTMPATYFTNSALYSRV